MPDYSTPFTSGFGVGASAGNMRAARMERMMELRAQEAQRAVQERLIAAQASMLTQHAKVYEQQALDEAQTKTDLLGANALYHEHLDKGKTPEEAQALTDAALQYKNPKAYEMLATGRKNMREVQQFTPQVVQPTDLTTGQPAVDQKTGEPIKAMTTGRGSAVRLDKNTGDVEEIANLVKAHRLALKSGDNELAEAFAGGLAKKIQNTGFVLETNPDGTFRLSQGAISGLQKSTTADIEKKLGSAETSLLLINESLPLINPMTVGPVGVAREYYEKGANIIKPGSIPTTTTKARETFRRTAQQQYASLKADSQINKLEAEAMKKIVDITEVDEASDTGRQKYETLRDLTGLQMVLWSHQIGKPAPDVALQSMSLDMVSRNWARKLITNEEVKRWNEFHGVVK